MSTEPSNGRLGVFAVGVGAVASTLMSGVELIRRGVRPAVGSFTQMGFLERPDGTSVRVSDALPVARLTDIVFGGVDLLETNAADAARTAAVLNPTDLALAQDFLATIKVGPGVFDPAYIGNLKPKNVRAEKTKFELAQAMAGEIRRFLADGKCARGVVLLTLSTEAWRSQTAVHATPESFLAGLKRSDPAISPAQIYAWAALEAGCPVVNCTPNQVPEVPALQAIATARGLPICGSDLKSGQTLMKTVVATGLAQRLLGIRGWYSTNILGNRDGLVLHAPDNFRAKEITKGGVLSDIFDAQRYPELYGDLTHQVHINYFPPKGDNKEAWDAIQLFGWLGYEMELKINFECRDSILAAPLVLDLALFTDLAARKKASGVQSWLASYFKSPAARPGETISNQLHIELATLHDQLRSWL
ncbi:inositol-3-phosphate synthase [Opitutus sp. ER46]|uniref:inositol-3-phosphate synthase n=1 Tax=Opitutus sp. ER46 TaxID=2161864 RepID=UPI000D303D94|nr:inositol-3-phosphate synthase [Opitutus sp. ER46]PTX96629.1 inositol-3-phosphate synthase [Opitutus sp. ER46]